MAANDYINILLQKTGRRATITINRPEKRNPLDWATVKELRRAVVEVAADPAILAVIVTGAGEAFSAGGDLEKYVQLFDSAPDFRGFLDDFYILFRAIEESGAIYIAAINGACVAGGIELLLACDVVIASDAARIGDGHLNFGQLPGAGSSIRLWRSIGAHRAKHLMFTGDLLTAAEAERIGLVNEVHPAAVFASAVNALAEKIERKSPVGLRGAKYLLNQAMRLDLEAGLRTELEFVHDYATTQDDPREGLRAFLEKRKPRFGL